jgi:small GTP-binding protein
MASTNQSPEYQAAEKKYLNAQSDEERLEALKEMMSYMPQHKAGESMRANLRLRYKKLKEKLELAKKKKKASSKPGIKKEGIQVILIGLTNSGKSSLLSILTNAKPAISNLDYTTQIPIIGMLDLEGIKFQIVDMPALNHETFDQGTANVADILLIMITDLKDLEKIFPYLIKTTGKRIILFNKSDLLNSSEKRKIQANLQSKRYDFCMLSCKTHEGIDMLKNKLIENSNVLRIYTKQPGKRPDKDPVLMKPGSTVQSLAKKVFHSDIKIKETRITGPSSKFPNQTVGQKHILKDLDIVEFHTE